MSQIDWSKAPEGATHYMAPPTSSPWRDLSGENWRWWDEKGFWSQSGNSSKGLLERRSDRLIPIPGRGLWNGKGLPPVGTFVHIHDPEGELMYGHGESGEVIAHVENTAVVRMSYGLGCFVSRHLRTPEQIAAEERESAITDIAVIMGKDPNNKRIRERAAVIYDAGYRKQKDT